ncbi:bifunctional diguanylate cyclase/phosphodiesterase [uncultured Photobacterium sp.]|uniref:bifunctional diguanylate cyclase/phosphodiesterase n=1 Tax=uncultured Photobacterium sp. TaxID=173973 RepID=UPI00260D4464|nr:bifunctional diguanylate cyclase/phosphodiesterase [uncultured Photobacterium sp.]
MKITELASLKLSTRTFLLFGTGLFAIAAICLFSARYFFLMNLNDIEQQQILQHSSEAESVVNILVQSQGKRAYDWASWDESYQLVTKGDDAYRDRNLYYNGLKSLDLDMMVFINRSGQIVESIMTTSPQQLDELSVSLREQLMSNEGIGTLINSLVSGKVAESDERAGLIVMDGDIWVVSVTPIRNSLGDSPVGGWLVWGRYLSTGFPSQFESILSSTNTLSTFNPDDNIQNQAFPVVAIEDNGKSLSACRLLAGFNGTPIAILKSSQQRTIFQEGNKLITWLAISMFIASVLIGVLTLFVFRLKVGQRFIALEEGLESVIKGQYKTQMKVEGNDEFSMVGEVINQILAKSSHTHSALNDVAEKFDALYKNSNLGLLMVLDEEVVDANDTMALILRYPSGAVLIGQPLLNLCPELGEQPFTVEKLYRAVENGERFFDVEMLAADASLIACKLELTLIKQQNSDALMLSVKDVSRQKEQEGLIKQLEKHDSVTGLVNRSTLFSVLEQKLAETGGSDCAFSPALLYVRIERFNIVAGAFGHHMADQILVAATNELRKIVDVGLLGRVSDSEFAFVLSTESRYAPYRYARTIVSALEQPLVVEGLEVRLSVSVGIVLSTKMTPTAEAMMNAGEYATYRAGYEKSSIQLFNLRVGELFKSHIVIQRDMVRAIRDGDIYPKFQPIVYGANEGICGFEALARWHHPELGEVSPAQFIPMAESRELIIALGCMILDKSCEFLAKVNRHRQDCGLSQLTMHVNLSSPHFSDPDLIPTVQSCLDRYDIQPNLLTIEITESILIGSTHQVIHQMQSLKSMGIKLALDDFGTGYSALNSLCEFPLDVVKIDQSFVKRIGIDHQGEILMSNIVSMSKALGLSMVAEGVETEGQKLALQALHIEELQGFYFYQPMSEQECMQAAIGSPLGSKRVS